MNTQTIDLEDIFTVWENQKTPKHIEKLSIEKCLKRRFPYGKRYGKMIITEAFGLFASIGFLFYFIGKWDLFQSEDAPQIGFVGTIATVIIAMADCAMMLFFILKASSCENTTLQMINNQRRLLKTERFEIFIMPILALPFVIAFVIPTMLWLVNSVNVYTTLQYNWETFVMSAIITIILTPIYATCLHKTSVRIINECIADLRVEIV